MQARGPAPNGHLDFITKYRRGVPDDDIPRYCERVMRKACGDFEADHVHLLVHYPPKACVSPLVNSLKSVPARMVRRQYTGPVNQATTNGHFWSPSYFAASCGGAPLSIIRQYIEQQQRPA
jgi:putative transposase